MRILVKLTAICVAAALAACSNEPGTPMPDPEDCETAGDEDGNGLADCSDPVCAGAAACLPACGDSRITVGEACDDGNATSGDGCDHNCTVTACGNGIVTMEEVCDDGNAANWDGCNNNCSGSTLAQQAYVKASNPGDGDAFGFSVALSADGLTLAVAAQGEFSAATGIGGNQADNSAEYAGAVYVFTRSGGTWIQQAYIKASNTDAYDWFGFSLALSADGSTLAVGAVFEDSAATGIDGNQADNSAANAGAVYVFARSGTMWRQQAYVKASNTGGGDFFGSSVALSADGSTLAVGARFEGSAATGIDGNQADNSAGQAGAVYLFTRAGTVWSQQAYVKASNTGALDWFGTSVALSSDGATLAVGAREEASAAPGIDGYQADNSATHAGAVYVLTRSGATWSQQAYVKPSIIGSEFGASLALSADGSTLAVGATGNTYDAGTAYVFTRGGSTWSQQARVLASSPGRNDRFGTSVALSADGSTLAVGAENEDSAATGIGGDQTDYTAPLAGAVFMFARSGTAWSQQAYVKASNTGSVDVFGYCVALSANGATLAVGAYGEDSAAPGVGGDQADNSLESPGAVYVFR